MKLTSKKLKEIIKQALNEMSYGDEYGDDSMDRLYHIRGKKMRRGPQPNYVEPEPQTERNPEEMQMHRAKVEAAVDKQMKMIQATFPGVSEEWVEEQRRQMIDHLMYIS